MRGTSVAEKWNRRMIIADIEDMIARGRDGDPTGWKPGEKLPTREALQAHYRASKHVIDGVIDIMKAAGKLRGVQGGRVYVAGAPDVDNTAELPPDPESSPG